jgi:hypothetical protein
MPALRARRTAEQFDQTGSIGRLSWRPLSREKLRVGLGELHERAGPVDQLNNDPAILHGLD